MCALTAHDQYGGPDRDLSRLQLNSAEAIAAVGHSSPSAAFDFVSNEPVFVLFKNELPLRHLNQEALDARRVNSHCGIGAPGCRPDVRTTVHFHGGHTHPQYGACPFTHTGARMAAQRRRAMHFAGAHSLRRSSPALISTSTCAVRIRTPIELPLPSRSLVQTAIPTAGSRRRRRSTRAKSTAHVSTARRERNSYRANITIRLIRRRACSGRSDSWRS